MDYSITLFYSPWFFRYCFGGSEICRLPNFSLENNKPLKDLKTAWMIGYQVKTYYLCCSLFLLFRQSFISVAGCRFKPSRWIGKGFGAVYSPTEEESSCKWEQSQVYLSYDECSRVSVNCSKRFTAWPFLILNEVWLPLHPTKGGKRMMFYGTMKHIFMW